MSLNDLVNVQVSVSAVSPSQENFGTPLVLAYHTVGAPSHVLVYTGMADADSGPQTLPPKSAAYRILQSMFSQNPRPPAIKLGRRNTAWSQTIDFAPQILTAGYVYSLTLDGQPVSYTVAATSGRSTGSAGPWALADGQTLTAAIDGGGAVTATFHATFAQITGAAATYAVLGGAPVMSVSVNGGAPIVITFTGAEHDEATYRATLDGQLVGAVTADAAGQIQIHTTRRGSSASIAITAGDAPLLTALGMVVGPGTNAGPNNVANIGAVTVVEYEAVCAPVFAPGAAALDTAGVPYVQSASTGPGSTIQMGGTARVTMGFDNATHAGLAISPTVVATGIVNAINAMAPSPGCTATVQGGTVVRCTATNPGEVVLYAGPALSKDLSLHVTDSSTGGGSVVADLNAVRLQDSDWYGLVVDAQDQQTIQNIAAAVETLRVIYVSDTPDSAVPDPTSNTDVAANLQSHGYTRTFVEYNQDVSAYAAAGLFAGRLTATPGSDTWMYKSIAGARPDTLSSTAENALKTKKANEYVLVSGVGNTQWGWSPSGEYMDLVRGIDWFVSTIAFREFLLFRANPKVPYTDAGIESIGNEIAAVASIAADDEHRLIVPGTFAMTLPKAASVPDADRMARVLNGVRFSARLQGAVHTLNISGVLAA